MLKIRLSRGGRKNIAYYKIVVAESQRPRDGKFIEKLGIYNPLLEHDNENRIVINKERIEHWLSVGAQPSKRIALFLCALGVAGAEKYKPVFTAKKKGDGAKKKALEQAAKQAESAAAEVPPAAAESKE